jgi:DNA gyrase subunit B
MDAATARTAAKKAREHVRAKQKEGAFSLNAVSKLTECVEKDPKKRELIILEGDSAGGSAKNGRDKNTQAIFALKGKPLNTEGVRIDVMYNNKEMADLISVVGTGIGDDFDLEKLQYHTIIQMADADVDGLHINTLLMGTFFRRMRPLIEHGMVYIASPPLYKIVEGKDSVSYIRDSSKLNAYLAKRFNAKGTIKASGGTFAVANLSKILKEAEVYDRKLKLLSSSMGCPIDFAAAVVEGYDADDAKTLRQAIAADLITPEIRGTTVLGEVNDGFISAVVTDREVPMFKDTQKAATKVANLIGDCQPPFVIKYGDNTKKTDTLRGLSEIVNDMTRKGINIGYLKGLGEMNPEQLWETTLDPAVRTLYQLKVDDFDEAGELINALLGDSPELRREIMQENVDAYPREALDI